MTKTVHIIGAGLSGLVAATELLKKGYHVTLIDQEPRQAIGWPSILVIRRFILESIQSATSYGVKDSYELALNDWLGSAQFDRLDGRTIGLNNGQKLMLNSQHMKRRTT